MRQVFSLKRERQSLGRSVADKRGRQFYGRVNLGKLRHGKTCCWSPRSRVNTSSQPTKVPLKLSKFRSIVALYQISYCLDCVRFSQWTCCNSCQHYNHADLADFNTAYQFKCCYFWHGNDKPLDPLIFDSDLLSNRSKLFVIRHIFPFLGLYSPNFSNSALAP